MVDEVLLEVSLGGLGAATSLIVKGFEYWKIWSFLFR